MTAEQDEKLDKIYELLIPASVENGKIIKIGTANFNSDANQTKSFSAATAINWRNLTIDNFIVEITSIRTTTGGASYTNTIEKSYNNTTGTFSVTLLRGMTGNSTFDIIVWCVP